MIDLINKISYTGFYAWLIAAVHPLIVVSAVAWSLYFLAGMVGIALGFKEESE